jgi:hypothetical protein
MPVPSELKAADRTAWSWPRRTAISLALATSHSIVCNPPFDHIEAFCRRGCAMARKVAMIMLTRWLNAAH